MTRRIYIFILTLFLALTVTSSAWYDPSTRSFLSRDPIREEGGVNLYAYCGNDPVGHYDPIGLMDAMLARELATARLAHTIDNGDETEAAAAQQDLVVLPGDPRLTPLSPSLRILGNVAGHLFSPSDADLALSPAQPTGTGFRHGASLYGWSLLSSAAQLISVGNDPSRLITGGQSASAQVIGQRYMEQFTYGERSAADFNLNAFSFIAPKILGAGLKLGPQLVTAVRDSELLNSGKSALENVRLSPAYLSPRAGMMGAVINPFAAGANTWQEYERAVRGLYGNTSFSARQYTVFLDGKLLNGVADNVAEIAGKRVAIEAKFVENWQQSIRNPASAIANRPFAVAERAKVLQRARQYSAAFDEVIYHSNSPEFIEYYTKVFSENGIGNFKFILSY